MFNPGETIIHQFIVPFVADEIDKVIVSYKQEGSIVFEKTITSGFEEADDPLKSKFSIQFTQEESLIFKEMKFYFVQLNVLTVYGTRATSKEIKGTNGAQYHKEVISS